MFSSLHIALAVLLTVQTQATQLTVTVTDPSGSRIENAEVVLNRGNEQRTFATGGDGTAQIRGLATGEWTLTVKRDGFAMKQRPVVIQGVPLAVSVSLDVAAIQESITVQGAPSPTDTLNLDAGATAGTLLDIPVRDLPLSLSIITQDLIQERGVGDAMEALELAGGVTTWTDSGSIPGIDVRGFSSTSASVSVLRDGVRQNSVPQSGRPLDTFFLERIEFLKGPSSLLYGEGASGGAVNYVTKEPKRQFLIDTLLSYGSFGTYRSGFGINVPLTSKLAFRVDGSHSDSGGYVDRTGSRLRTLVGSVLWRPLESVKLKATATYSDDSVRSYYGTPLINGVLEEQVRFKNYNMRDNLNKSHNNFGRIDAEIGLPGGWRLRNGFYASTHRTDWRNFESVSYNATTQRVTLSSYFLAKRDDVVVGNNTDIKKTFTFLGRTVDFATGFSVTDNNWHRWNTPSISPAVSFSLDLLNPAPVFDPGFQYNRDRDVFANSKAIFGDSAVHLTGRLTFMGGLRWEQIAVDYTPLATRVTASKKYYPTSGRGGFVFAVTPAVNLYFSTSRAVQPTAALVSLSGANQQFSLQPHAQWEGGAKATVLNGRLDATAAYFSIGKRNILTRNIVDGVNVQQQIGRQVSNGFEFSFIGRPIRTFMLAGDFTAQNAEYKEFNENVTGGGIISRAGNDVSFVPAVVWNVTPAQTVGPVTISATVRTVGARWRNTANTIRLAPYTTVNSSIAIRFGERFGRFKGMRLVLSGRNLTDKFYIPRSNSDLSGRIAAPRSFDAQLTKTF